MPALPLPTPTFSPKILVTGANGYIALWVVRTLLEKGYSVRGTVRSEDKAAWLASPQAFGDESYGGKYKGKTEWVIVKDIGDKDAFDDAVKDVDGIIHMASPLSASGEDPDEYIRPAVNGTLEVLKSVLKNGKNVKRIVITSSTGAIIRTIPFESPDQPTVILSESDWGDEMVETAKREGSKAPMMAKYRASKVLAERAAWDFVKEHQVDWDITTICPPYVLGPSLQNLSSPADLRSSLVKFYKMIFLEQSDKDLEETYTYVDVRDVSLAHVLALSTPEAGSERIIVALQGSTWQKARNLVHKLAPKLYTDGILPRGKPEIGQHVLFEFSNEKSKRIFGIDYIPEEKTVSDILADFEGRGWVEKKAALE